MVYATFDSLQPMIMIRINPPEINLPLLNKNVKRMFILLYSEIIMGGKEQGGEIIRVKEKLREITIEPRHTDDVVSRQIRHPVSSSELLQ